MIRKWAVVGIILLFVGVTIVPAIAQTTEKQSVSQGNWLYVGGSGPGNYTRIQDAIENASEGDTIFVYQGVYFEHDLNITKLDLIGEERNTTIINGEGRFTEGIHLGEGATIRGFIVQYFTEYDIALGIGTGLYIDGNNIIVSDNIIRWCSQGIFFKEHCYNIDVHNNVFYDIEYYGLYLQSLACSIHDNYFRTTGYGIYVLHGTRQVSIDYNHFERNDVAMWARSTRATVRCNNFIDNDAHVSLQWDATLLTLPFVFYRIPSFSENFWDDWNGEKPRAIHGYFKFWILLPEVSILVFTHPIVQYDRHPAQERYEIPKIAI